MKKHFLLLALTCVSTFYYAQDEGLTKVSPEVAANKMKMGNYEDALVDFLQLLNEDPKNELYNYNVGVCYLNNNTNKGKAVPYLEIVTRKEKHDPNADYLLGRA